jgi:hypothetical protein
VTAPMRTLAAAVMAAAILFPFAATAQSPIIIKFSHVVAPDTPKGNPHLVSVPKVRSEPEHRKRCCRALALKSTSAPEGQAAAKFLDRHARSRPATEQPKKSCRANSESKRKNRPKEAPKPRLLRQSALSAFELLESGSREPRG